MRARGVAAGARGGGGQCPLNFSRMIFFLSGGIFVKNTKFCAKNISLGDLGATLKMLNTLDVLCRKFAAVCRKIATFCPS